MPLKLLKREFIDFKKWDSCVSESTTPSICAKSWFLDVVAQKNWQGLVLDDYVGVMPIFPKNKFGLKYNIPPFLSKENGVFIMKEHEFQSSEFFHFLKKNFLYNIVLSRIDVQLPGWSKISRQNHVLDLSNMTYNRNVKRNIKNAFNYNVELKDVFDINVSSTFLVIHEPSQHLKKHEDIIKSLLKTVIENKFGFIKGAYIQDRLVAVGVFVIDEDRVNFLLCASNDEGKKSTALFEILNQTIQNIDNKKVRYFDFAGSSIENIARRNLGFGAQSHQYFHYKRFMLNF